METLPADSNKCLAGDLSVFTSVKLSTTLLQFASNISSNLINSCVEKRRNTGEWTDERHAIVQVHIYRIRATHIETKQTQY